MRKGLLYAFQLATQVGAGAAALAQPFPELRFQHLTEKDGLSSNAIACVIQDHKGYIWVGTDNGLNRFDGYQFRQFFHEEKDNTALASNVVHTISIDPRDNIWVSTAEGVSYLDRASQHCTNYLNSTSGSTKIKAPGDGDFYQDPAGYTWLTTAGGLYRFDAKLHYREMNEGVQEFRAVNKNHSHYTKIVPDRKGRLWAFETNRLYLLDSSTKAVMRTFDSVANWIQSLYFDSENRCWISDYDGHISEFDEKRNTSKKLDLGARELNLTAITEWEINAKKYLVLGNMGNGLVLLDTRTMHYRVYRKDPFGKDYLSCKRIRNLFVDRQNILWLATDGGLSYITPLSLIYDIKKIPPRPDRKFDSSHEPAAANVYSFLPDESGNWVSTFFRGGIYRYDKDWKLKKYFPRFTSPAAESGVNSSMAYYFRRWNSELYCTTDSGLYAMDTGTYKTRHFYPGDIPYPITLRNMIPVNDSTWWIRSHDYGIYVFNIVTKKFVKHYQHHEGCANCLPAARLEWLLRAPGGALWITSEDGLYEYRPASDDFGAYKRNVADAITFPSDYMAGAALDTAGKLWIATESGICVFNTLTRRVERVFPENKTMGLVYRVCLDDHQNVWFNTINGSYCWLRKSDRLVHLSSAEGFPTSDMLTLFVNGGDGSVYNGVADALVRYYPERLMKEVETASAPVFISELTVNGKVCPYLCNAKNEKHIRLQPFQNSFTVDFATLNYDGVNFNRYYFRLAPADKDWRQNSNGHLSFNGLPPGDYRLEVKGGNAIAGNFPNTDILLISIEPHWWQSWWCGILVVLTAAGILTIALKRRIATIKREAGFRQKIAETEMQALRAQMNPHFIFNSLSSIENFMMKNEKRMAVDYLGKFAQLIRMILESSRNEWMPFAKDMEALRLYVELEQLRFNNKFAFRTIIDPELLSGDYLVPPLLTQPFVENAILHGLSQCERDQAELLVMAVLEKEYILYTVQDNGIGREQAAVYKRQKIQFHKSAAISITQDRINIFNQQQRADGKVTITDLFDEYGEPAGTRVQIKLKAI